jgi:hypothetical protein
MALREVDLTEALQSFIDECGGQKAASAKLGCSPQFVNMVLHGKKRAPDTMLSKLGLRRRDMVTEK